MIPQYTSAALVSENKLVCFPDDACAYCNFRSGQEDHLFSALALVGKEKLNKTYK